MAVGTILPTISITGAVVVGLSAGTIVPFLLVGVGVLLAVPFPLAIYRDATYVRLNSGDWQPNPGTYVGFSTMFFVLAPLVFPIIGGYYLIRRHVAIGTV